MDGSKFFPLRVGPFSEASRNNFDRVASLEIVSLFQYICVSTLAAPCQWTLILLITTTPTFANSEAPDQMASDQDLHCLSVRLWIWRKTLYDVIWLADSQKWVWLIKLFSRIRVKVDNVDRYSEESQKNSKELSPLNVYPFPLTLSLPQAIIIGFCKQHRSRWDGSMSDLIWIYAVWHSVYQLYI